MAAAAAGNSSSGIQKVCFNSNCKAVLERVNKGWRRRTGEFAELCDRCSSAYEAGNFCEAYHLNSSGWRCCESCGKQIHCGCIVSFHMFVLLDAGGIECLTCARKSFILTPNPAWPPPSLFLPVQPERIKEISTRNWPAIAGSGPVPWRQAPSVFNGTASVVHQADLGGSRLPLPIEMDRQQHRFHERLSSPPVEKRKMEESLDRLMSSSLKISCSGVIGGSATPVGNSVEKATTSSLNHFQQIANNNSMTWGSPSGLVSTFKPETDNHHPMVVAKTSAFFLPTVVYPQTEKRSSGQNQTDVSRSCGQNHQTDVLAEAQTCNGKARGGDVRGRGQLLPRYWPRISEEELQKISENSNSVITPLFEKMLSASDAGRIGRLVLPKKCAEAYFPPISQPEGVPLKIQDLKGKEWVFQFRFWPNNNSRMYVLEGIMPCIQSMQLQAGDIVTFSRIEPEGKLVMGCRKAITDKGNETSTLKPCSNVEGGMDKGKKVGEMGTTINVDAASPSPSLQPPPSEQKAESPAASNLYGADKHVGGGGGGGGSGADVVVGKANSSSVVVRAAGKRRNNTVGLKRKRLRIDSEDAFELKVSWEQVQGLLRPAGDRDATVCVVEGCEIEEFEEGAPVIGRPTIPESDRFHGKKMQWVQCEKCFKWRKVPTDALLKSQWTCSDNQWDPHRSRCAADEELTAEKLEALLLTTTSNAVSEKKKEPTPDPEIEALEGLDALVELAIQEKEASSSSLVSPSQHPPPPPTSSKHPRHKPGCSCIVCIQPPSGKGPKHKQPCDCVVCKSVKRRFETLSLKREQKQLSSSSEKEPEPEQGSPEQGEIIDLNIRLDREEDRRGGGGMNNKEKHLKPDHEEDRHGGGGGIVVRKISPENSGNGGDRRLGGGMHNKKIQIKPGHEEDRHGGGVVTKISPEGGMHNKEIQIKPDHEDDRHGGGVVTKISPENSENGGDRRLGVGMNNKEEIQLKPEISLEENTENGGPIVYTAKMAQEIIENSGGEENTENGGVMVYKVKIPQEIIENSGGKETISENKETTTTMQKSTEYVNGIEHHHHHHHIMASVTLDSSSNHVSSPGGVVVASVTPADRGPVHMVQSGPHIFNLE